MTTRSGLLPDELVVVNVGLDVFAEDLEAQGVGVVRLEWRPPVGGALAATALERLLDETGVDCG